MSLMNVAKPEIICAFALPRPPHVTGPWKPMFLVSLQLPFFLLQGTQGPRPEAATIPRPPTPARLLQPHTE